MNQQQFYQKKFDTLAPQRQKVLLMMSSGKTDREIAKFLAIQETTVRKHIEHIGEHFDIGTDKEFTDQRCNRREQLKQLCKKYNFDEFDLYVERQPYETQCYEEILKAGAFIRIKAPEQMGKTSFLSRALEKINVQGYQTVKLDFQLADSNVLSDYQHFLKWLCVNVGESLELPDKLGEFWKDHLGVNRNCTRYFQKYLLAEIPTPLLLGFDNVDIVFEQPALFTDFCKLLRYWYDLAKESDHIGKIWKKLRLVIVHSTAVYRTMDINSSPLSNVGLTIELPEFNQQQAETLANRYRLNYNSVEITQLMQMVGGHPALLKIAFNCLKGQNISLEELLKTASTEQGIFSDHLRRHLQNLRQHPELVSALFQCVNSTEPVQLASELGFKLHRMGLVEFKENNVIPRCDIYRHYFKNRLSI